MDTTTKYKRKYQAYELNGDRYVIVGALSDQTWLLCGTPEMKCIHSLVDTHVSTH